MVDLMTLRKLEVFTNPCLYVCLPLLLDASLTDLSQDPADLPPFQLEGDYASPSEQSTTPGDYLGNDAYGRDPPFYLSPGEQFAGYDVISGEPVARPMVSPDTISSPTLSSYLSPSVRPRSRLPQLSANAFAGSRHTRKSILWLAGRG